MQDHLIKTITKRIGIDKSIAYSSGARVVAAIAGVGTLFFIGSCLTSVEQGFYFTFTSILALQVFFELGLTGIMTQYVAHEASYLKIDVYNCYHGEQKYISRLSSLIHFCIKWYSVIAILSFFALYFIGFVYFTRYGSNQGENVKWIIPWLLLCFGTSLKLFQSPLTSILLGLGFVKDQSKVTFYQQIIQPLIIWIGLISGLKLYVVGIAYLASVMLWFFMSYRMGHLNILHTLLCEKLTEKVSYVKEIFPFQWKIALSWISGYFIFQLFNPVLFATEGAVIAGQMGMTLQALNAINVLAMSWQNTKVPLYSSLIAQKKYIKLDVIFGITLKQMLTICCVLLILFFCFIACLRYTSFTVNGSILAERFLDYVPLILLMLTVLINQFTSSWATYCRCHKQEPFLMNSVCGGLACCVSTLLFGHIYGLYGVVIGYFVITVVFFPWGYYIYKSKKMQWHER